MKIVLSFLISLICLSAKAQDCGSFHFFNFNDTMVTNWTWPDPKAGFAFDMAYDSLTAANTGYISFYFVDQNNDTITNPDYYKWSFFFPWTVDDTLRYVMVLDSGLNSFPSNFDGYLVTENPPCRIPYSNKGVFIAKFDPLSSIRLYPNPTDGKIILELNENSQGQVIIYDILGTEVYSEIVGQKSIVHIDLPESLKNGVYLVKFIGEDEAISSRLVLRR